MSDKPLSLRHECFVQEYLKDGNATRAYIRAGYSARGAQPGASRLLRDPRIEAAIAAGRQRISEALAVSLERVTQEYAKIAFANVADYVSTDADGRLRIDLDKAHQAQQAGIVELKIANHNKQEQQVTLKLGKLQALAALAKQLGAAAKPKAKPEVSLEGLAEDLQSHRLRYQAEERANRLERELSEARMALALAEVKPRRHSLENPNPSVFPIRRERREDEPPRDAPPAPEPPPPPAPEVMPGMPTQPLPDHVPGLYPNARFTWSGGRDHGLGPDSADALRMMKPGGFPGW
jgi:phage terminase small subunit